MINQTKESNFNDLLSQIYINSKICNSKFKNYNNGLNYAILSILLLFLTKFCGIIQKEIVWLYIILKMEKRKQKKY